MVAFKYFKNSYKNEDHLGIIINIQTDVLYPTEWGYDRVDLLLISWFDEQGAWKIPYHTLGANGERWYLKSKFHIVGEENGSI